MEREKIGMLKIFSTFFGKDDENDKDIWAGFTKAERKLLEQASISADIYGEIVDSSVQTKVEKNPEKAKKSLNKEKTKLNQENKKTIPNNDVEIGRD